MNPLVVPFGYENVDEINEAMAEGRTIVWYDDKVLDENLEALERWTHPEDSWEQQGWVPLGQTSDFDYYEYEEEA